MRRLLALFEHRGVDAVIIAKLDRLTQSVKDLTNLVLDGSARKVDAFLQQPGVYMS
jgi:DNA invertase Pin-like site-specific DNA recombinase